MSLVKPEKMVDTAQFLQEVDQFSRATSCGYMDAVIHIAGIKGIEIETAAAMIKTSSKAKSFLQESAEEMNFLPRTSRLPV